MPLDPKGLTIDTFSWGKNFFMRIWHEPSGCMVEGDLLNPLDTKAGLKKRLLQELSEKVFMVNT